MENEQSTIRILVAGLNGSGRTSIIQAVMPETTIPQNTPDLTFIYKSDKFEMIDAKTPKEDEDAAKFRSSILLEAGNVQTDCTWFCIDGRAGKATERQLDLIDSMGRNTLILITHSDQIEDQVREKLIQDLSSHYAPERLVLLDIPERQGVIHLIQLTMDLIHRPDLWTIAMNDSPWHNRIQEKANSFIMWGAGRAFAIAAVPLPLADVTPLIVNEIYMIYRVGACYGIAVNKAMATGFLASIGASIGGKILASFIPFLKAPIAAAMTYGIGVAAREYFASGMKLGKDELKKVFESAQAEGEHMNWQKQ